MRITTKVGLRLVGVEDEHKGSGARIYDRNGVKLAQTDPLWATQNPRLDGKQATEARRSRDGAC